MYRHRPWLSAMKPETNAERAGRRKRRVRGMRISRRKVKTDIVSRSRHKSNPPPAPDSITPNSLAVKGFLSNTTVPSLLGTSDERLRCVSLFRESMMSVPLPDRNDHLEATAIGFSQTQIDEICTRFLSDWQSGRRPRIESLLNEVPVDGVGTAAGTSEGGDLAPETSGRLPHD